MTKAKTSAARLKAKRGRPKLEVAYREPNGRASRAKEPADKVALEARARMLGISVVQAKDQKAGTFIGYLRLLGPRDGLSESQYQAAVHYMDLRGDYLRSLKAPNAYVDSEGMNGGGDAISDAYVNWCEDVRKAYDGAQKAIQTAQNSDRSENYWASLDLCVIRDQHHHHLISATRCVCNVLARYFNT